MGSLSKFLNILNKRRPLSKGLAADYNESRTWGPKEKLCYAPYSSLFINTLGMVRPCYANKVEGTYPQNSIADIWFGKDFDKIRDQVSSGDLSQACEFCNSFICNNNFGGVLAKKYDNPEFHNDIQPSGKNNIYPKIIEFELSNSCDLECIMCDGNLSSSIRKNREKRQALKSPYDDNFLGQLDEFIPHLKVAEFTGGSPFLISMYYKIWDRILDLNPDCTMLITTSANTMNAKVEALLERGRFNFNISLDSIEKSNYEKIRVNANFDKVMNNIKILSKHCIEKKTYLCFLVCPLRYNWKEFPDLLRFANDYMAPLFFHIVIKPFEHALWSLPSKELEEIIDYLSGFEFPGETENQRTNQENYNNLLEQIRVWHQKAINREKQDPLREKELEEKIATAKSKLYEKLKSFSNGSTGDRSYEKLSDRMEHLVKSLPSDPPGDLIYLKLNSMRTKYVVKHLRAYENGHTERNELIERGKRSYDHLVGKSYCIKYAANDAKYQLNMQY